MFVFLLASSFVGLFLLSIAWVFYTFYHWEK